METQEGYLTPFIPAWGAETSSSGMGWLSFNCLSNGDCPSVDYGVDINDTTGDMTGYAWAGNSADASANGVGWIKFGGLSGFPSGPGTTSSNAKEINGNVVGWARACAVFHSGCSGGYYHGAGPIDNNIATNPYLGGWDGWISLNGSGYDVTIDQNTGVFAGYAWGGANVLGWINFSQVAKDAVITPPLPGSASLVLNAETTLVYPTSSYQTNLYWTSNIALTGCVATNTGSPSTPTWSGSVGTSSSTPSQRQVFVPADPVPVKYDLRCFDGAVPVDSNPVFISRGILPERVSLTSDVVVSGQTTLYWTTTNVVPGSCVASTSPAYTAPLNVWSGIKTTSPAGSQDGTGSEAGVGVPSTSPSNTVYTITCTGFYSGLNDVIDSISINELSGPATSNRQPFYEEQ